MWWKKTFGQFSVTWMILFFILLALSCCLMISGGSGFPVGDWFAGWGVCGALMNPSASTITLPPGDGPFSILSNLFRICVCWLKPARLKYLIVGILGIYLLHLYLQDTLSHWTLRFQWFEMKFRVSRLISYDIFYLLSYLDIQWLGSYQILIDVLNLSS